MSSFNTSILPIAPSVYAQAAPEPAQLHVADAHGHYVLATPGQILEAAREAIVSLVPSGTSMSTPSIAERYAVARLAGLEHEVFAVFFLDNQLRLIQYRELFQGTLNQTAVYPREVVKEVLKNNAGAVILVHNHPSGKLEPSQVDRQLTERLKKALELIDVRVLDHLIVGPSADTTSYSFAEHGDL
ncbi:RadC family protein [Alcaligenes faecalis]|uniref:RadC family protein n=1 Tax=Alcaligenes faecalis TaxID=511 RepID=UPI00293348ED|nr:DNA repair protein RadC [Alcaligenes faecalis]MDV2114897.1 DNA repair protein RadC [Alcaligenes faecalis]